MTSATRKFTSAVVTSIAIAVILTACSSTPAAKVSASPAVKVSKAPATGTVRGLLSVTAAGNIRVVDSTHCAVSDESGYGDLNMDTEVDAVDASGKVLAFSSLGAGETSNSGDNCFFPFTIMDVPRGGKVYGLKFGNRGISHYTEKQFFAPKLFPSIGA